MKTKAQENNLGGLCRKLKEQLDQLSEVIVVDPSLSDEEKRRRRELMQKLAGQLKELSD